MNYDPVSMLTTSGAFLFAAPDYNIYLTEPTAEDYALIHAWVNQPRAKFWGMQNTTMEQVTDRYTKPHPGESVRMIEVEGRKAGFFVFYRPDTSGTHPHLEYDPEHDAMANAYVSKEHDAGHHTFIAPQDDWFANTYPDFTAYAMRAAWSYLFKVAGAARIVGAPDLGNVAAVARCVQAGYQLKGVIHMPHKTAQLMMVHRWHYDTLPYRVPPVVRIARDSLRIRFHMLAGRIGRKLGLIERNW